MLEAAEITRLAYLEALGMANYVSRRPLPAAAPSRKLAIAAIAGSVQPVIDDVPTGRRFEDLDVSEAKLTRVAAPVSKPGAAPSAVDSFSVAAIFAGGWLWLEELSGVPLAREQVQLISAIARALNLDPDAPQIAQFDWPIHTNRQLDLGSEAAASSLAGFLQRQLGEYKADRLVILGTACHQRLPASVVDPPQALTTVSTRQMLSDSTAKRQAWRDLSPLARSR